MLTVELHKEYDKGRFEYIFDFHEQKEKLLNTPFFKLVIKSVLEILLKE